MTKFDYDPDGVRLPIKVDTTSNGEFAPIPLSRVQKYANQLALESATDIARKLNMPRRKFLVSAAGSAATLLAFNQAHAAAGGRGGGFNIPADAGHDTRLAQASVGGNEFIFDGQNHCMDPEGSFITHPDGKFWVYFMNEVFSRRHQCEPGSLDCYSARNLIKDVLLDSDTTVNIVSALFGLKEANPISTEYMVELQEMAKIIGPKHKRTLIHGGISPLEPNWRESMEVQAKEFGVNAWKFYPQWGPKGSGFYMDDPELAFPVYERARELGVKIVCAHRGLPLQGMEHKYSVPRDIAPAAKAFPDMTFVAYHSGVDVGKPEGPYNPDDEDGMNRLITSFIENGHKRNAANMYVDVGSVWRTRSNAGPDQAAHFLGKLFKYFGENQICWGTDCIFYGSPQDQIQTFRTFQISKEFQEKFGYPEITPEMRAKVFGLNSARIYGIDPAEITRVASTDTIGRIRQEYRENPNPSFATYGPKTRREFLTQWRKHGERPDL